MWGAHIKIQLKNPSSCVPILYTSWSRALRRPLNVSTQYELWLKLCSIRYSIFGVWCSKCILSFPLPGIKILNRSSTLSGRQSTCGRSRTPCCLYGSVWFNSKLSKLYQVYFDIIRWINITNLVARKKSQLLKKLWLLNSFWV